MNDDGIRGFWIFMAFVAVLTAALVTLAVKYGADEPPCSDYRNRPREYAPARCFDDFRGSPKRSDGHG